MRFYHANTFETIKIQMKLCKYAIIKIFETVKALLVQSKNMFTAEKKTSLSKPINFFLCSTLQTSMKYKFFTKIYRLDLHEFNVI